MGINKLKILSFVIYLQGTCIVPSLRQLSQNLGSCLLLKAILTGKYISAFVVTSSAYTSQLIAECVGIVFV